MIAPPMSRRVFWTVAVSLALAALALRLWGIAYGLPQTFNGDEPHHVNIAVSFGRGSLHPGLFKYPTLWMYVMAGAYGVYFLVWSGFGMLRSVGDFAALFAWDPGGFYLIARLLSTAAQMAALIAVYRAACSLERPRVGVWAAALLCASPTLTVSAHAAKPDSLMLLFAALAWLWAMRHLETGDAKYLLGCAAATGFCVSTQYVAAPLVLLGPLAWMMRRLETREGSWKFLALCGAVVGAAFFIGSPFVLIDWRSAWRDIVDTGRMAWAAGTPAGVVVLENLGRFADPYFIGGGLACGGAAWLMRRRQSLAIAFVVPVAAQAAFLAVSPNGGWSRFLIPVFPALALCGAFAFESLLLRFKPGEIVRGVLLAILVAPGAARSLSFDAELVLPDTRTAAAEWIERSLPEGAGILTFNPHTAPRLRQSLEQVRSLLAETEASGHPRARLYRIMADSHPGGGFKVLRVAQDADVLQSGPRHVAFSAAGRAVVDVSGGLTAARAAGADYFVYTSYGSSKEGFLRMAAFLSEVEREGVLLERFSPEPGARRGPEIKIFKIKESS